MCADLLAVVYTRLPQPGRAKTRLIPALGAEGAAELQRAMTGHCLQQLRAAADAGHCRIRVDFAGDDPGPDARAMADWLGSDLAYAPQAAGDLGARLLHSFR
ncbi:MAG: hypothetical protein ACOCXJ_00505, partial [Planctomycetota bacterium]